MANNFDLYLLKIIKDKKGNDVCDYFGIYSSKEIQTFVIMIYGFDNHSENCYIVDRNYNGDNEKYKHYRSILESEIRNQKIVQILK